jgi:hypothetical protein
MKLFLDLKGVVSEQEPLMRLYKNENGENVFVIRTIWNENTIYVNYDLIFRPLKVFLETDTNMKTRDFLDKWFKNKYGIIVNDWVNHFSKDDYIGMIN